MSIVGACVLSDGKWNILTIILALNTRISTANFGELSTTVSGNKCRNEEHAGGDGAGF